MSKLTQMFVFVVFLIGLGTGSAIEAKNVSEKPRCMPHSFADIVEPVLPAVVGILTKSQAPQPPQPGMQMPNLPEGHPFLDLFRDFFGKHQNPQTPSGAMGTGFIIDPSGYIVTNNHLVDEAEDVVITLNDHKHTELKAKIIGRDPGTDLALLKVESPKKLPYVKWGRSTQARVGDWVVVVGSPFGLAKTVTAGIISTIAREISLTKDSGAYLDGYIQTDASINVGNSGGPMFNLHGDVIGINTAILTQTGGNLGIGFAIPADDAKIIIEQLKTYGRTKRGWLGIQIQQMTPEIAESLGMKKAQGILVGRVLNQGPAASAGLKVRDVIIEYQGQSIEDVVKFQRLVSRSKINTVTSLKVIRNQKIISLKINVGEFEKAQDEGKVSSFGVSSPQESHILGLSVREMTKSEASRLKNKSGIVISKVTTKSDAFQKGLRPGDILLEADTLKIMTTHDFQKAVTHAKKAGKKNILLLIRRGTALLYLALPIKGSL